MTHSGLICEATIEATRGSGWYSPSTVMPRVETIFSGLSVSPSMIEYCGGQ